MALLVVRQWSRFEVVERSRKGTGFDYWLGLQGDPLFRRTARLETSGLRRGNAARIEARVRRKLKQVRASDGTSLPALVAVVEFGGPNAKVVIHEAH